MKRIGNSICVYFVLCFALIVISFSSVFASVIKMEVPEMYKDSDLVIIGKVEDVRSEWNKEKLMNYWEQNEMMVTYTTIIVNKYLKGSTSLKKIIVMTLGGNVNGENLWVSDQPEFIKGERVLVFLNRYDEKDLWDVVGSFQGKFTTKHGKVFRKGFPRVSIKTFIEIMHGNQKKTSFELKDENSESGCDPQFWVYPYAEERMGVPFLINEEGTKDCEGEFDAIGTAAIQWSIVVHQYFWFLNSGAPVSSKSKPRDGKNVISWVSGVLKDTVARTFVYTPRTDPDREEFDMIFNDNYKWSAAYICPADSYDVWNVATHEFGHVVGLDHTSETPECADQTMYPWGGTGEIIRRDLADADIEGIQILYPYLKLTFDAAGVGDPTSIYVNDESIGELPVNSGAGYLTNTFEFKGDMLKFNQINNIYIRAGGSPYDDIYDDIQITNIKLEHSNDEILFEDAGVYHLGDQTIAAIQESYEEGGWKDPNPPSFWVELCGTSLTIPFRYPYPTDVTANCGGITSIYKPTIQGQYQGQ